MIPIFPSMDICQQVFAMNAFSFLPGACPAVGCTAELFVPAAVPFPTSSVQGSDFLRLSRNVVL